MKTNFYLSLITILTFWSCGVRGQIAVRQLTGSTNDNTWGIRNSSTSDGRVLWVDGDGSVIYFNGTTTNIVQAQDSLGAVDEVVFALGSGTAPGSTMAAWRRGTDSGWISMDGGPPTPVNATNPIDPSNGLNAEGVAIADGSIFMILQAGTFKHVFKIDPVTGAGVDLTGNAHVPGAQGRLSTSRGQAVWPFQDDTNNISKLHFYDGSSLHVLETNIDGNPVIANGRIVYLKQVDGIDQVFLFDTTSAFAPVQITDDVAGTNSFPTTDGAHIAWLHTAPGATNPVIMLSRDIELTTPDTALPVAAGDFREHPFQLNRGQILWEDLAGRLQYHAGTSPFALDTSPSTSFGSFSGTPCCIPWLTDGFISWTGLSGDGSGSHQVFLMNLTPPDDSRQPSPPLLLRATPGQGRLTLTWDNVIGATSYNLYLAEDATLNQTNYASLPAGRKIAGVRSPYTITGLTNRIYFCAISSLQTNLEGPCSPLTMAALWSTANAPATNFYAIAAGLTNGGTVYASGGRALWQSTDGGANWNPLAGGSEGLDVRALAVDGPRVYAATRDVFNGPPAQIFRSLDSGASWTAVVPDGGQPGEQNKTLAIDPTHPARLYAADFRLPTINLPGDSYVIRSDDAGDEWFHLPNPATPLGAEIDAYSLIVHPLNPALVYAGGSGTPNLVRSSDYGTNWVDANVGPGFVYSLAIDPTNPAVLYAGVVNFTQASRGVLKTTDSGATWSASNTGLPSPLPRVYSLLIDPLNPSQIHAATDAGYYFSLDAGNRWVDGNSALPNGQSQFVAALTLTETRQLLAASAGGIYRLDLSRLNLVLPELTLTTLGPNAILSWPDAANGFFLESAESLEPHADWTNVTNPILVTNGLRSVIVDLTNRAGFFRLIKP